MTSTPEWIRTDLDAARRVTYESLQLGKTLSGLVSPFIQDFTHAYVIYSSPGSPPPDLVVGHGAKFEIEPALTTPLAASGVTFVMVEDDVRVSTDPAVRVEAGIRPITEGSEVYWVGDVSAAGSVVRRASGYPTNGFLMRGSVPSRLEDLDLASQLIAVLVGIWDNESLLLLSSERIAAL